MSVCCMALGALRVDDESAGTGGNMKVKRKLVYTSSPHGITPGRKDKREGQVLA